MDSVKFTTKDGKYEFSVTPEFLELVPNYSELGIDVLFVEHRMEKFLHNETGPSVTQLELDEGHPNKYIYFLNGDLVSKTDFEQNNKKGPHEVQSN